jgi:large subunit ribosomal protein L16
VGFIFLTRKKGQVVLYPKRTRFRKYQKGKFKGCTADGTQLCFGKYGMKSCKAGRISHREIETARCIINREFQRNGQIWVRVFADIPITSKPTEVRMGKGKGNSTCWIARVVEAQILFEMDGVSFSNAQKAAALVAHKLCLSTKFVQWF